MSDFRLWVLIGILISVYRLLRITYWPQSFQPFWSNHDHNNNDTQNNDTTTATTNTDNDNNTHATANTSTSNNDRIVQCTDVFTSSASSFVFTYFTASDVFSVFTASFRTNEDAEDVNTYVMTGGAVPSGRSRRLFSSSGLRAGSGMPQYTYIYIYICMYMCVYIYIYIDVFLYLSISLSLYIYIYIYTQWIDAPRTTTRQRREREEKSCLASVRARGRRPGARLLPYRDRHGWRRPKSNTNDKQ